MHSWCGRMHASATACRRWGPRGGVKAHRTSSCRQAQPQHTPWLERCRWRLAQGGMGLALGKRLAKCGSSCPCWTTRPQPNSARVSLGAWSTTVCRKQKPSRRGAPGTRAVRYAGSRHTVRVPPPLRGCAARSTTTTDARKVVLNPRIAAGATVVFYWFRLCRWTTSPREQQE
jgi:hypothetical protein